MLLGHNYIPSPKIHDRAFPSGKFQLRIFYAYSISLLSLDFEILDTQKGTYTIEVYSYNSSLKLSPEATTTTFDAEGKTALPDDVQNLTLEPVDQHFVRLRWTQSTAVDVLHGGRVYIRHTDQIGVSATFQAGQNVQRTFFAHLNTRLIKRVNF